jgi:hypothetical protein
MSEKENKVNEPEIKQPAHEAKKVKRYSKKNQKSVMKLNDPQTELHAPRGKKQRRKFKLAPNRG